MAAPTMAANTSPRTPPPSRLATAAFFVPVEVDDVPVCVAVPVDFEVGKICDEVAVAVVEPLVADPVGPARGAVDWPSI